MSRARDPEPGTGIRPTVRSSARDRVRRRARFRSANRTDAGSIRPAGPRLTAAITIALAALPGLAGCAATGLEGLVVSGDAPDVWILSPTDARLQQRGLAAAALELTIDPASLSPTTLSPVITDERGRFQTVIAQAGAGFLEFELGLLCKAAGHRSLYRTMPLPRSGSVLLIVLKPGRDRPGLSIGNDQVKRQVEQFLRENP